MEVLATLVSSKLWIQGCTKITFKGDSDWNLFYNIEGVHNKHWTLFFFNNNCHKVFLRSPHLDLKLSGLVVQKSNYVSNIYSLMVEKTDPTHPTSIWKVDHSHPDAGNHSPSVLYLSGGVTPLTRTETYFCAPAILMRDVGTKKLKPDEYQPNQFVCDNNQFIKLKTVSGYVMTCGRSPSSKKHCNHHLRAWLPWININSETFRCRFQISCSSPRRHDECLECRLSVPSTGLLSSPMTAIIINH